MASSPSVTLPDASRTWTAPAPVTWEPGSEVSAAISTYCEYVVYRAMAELGGAKHGVLRLRLIGDAGVLDLVRPTVVCSCRCGRLMARTSDCQVVDGGTPPFDLSPDGRYAIQALPPKSNGHLPTARVMRTDLLSGARVWPCRMTFPKAASLRRDTARTAAGSHFWSICRAISKPVSCLLLLARVPMETDLYYADRLPAKN